MTDDDEIDAWKRAKAEDDRPAGFADDVMRAVDAEAAGARRGRTPLAALAESPLARAAALLVAAALFAARVASLFAVFVAP